MDNDYNTLKEIFEMTEILTYEGDNFLKIEGIDEKTGGIAEIIFRFNVDKELTNEVTVVE